MSVALVTHPPHSSRESFARCPFGLWILCFWIGKCGKPREASEVGKQRSVFGFSAALYHPFVVFHPTFEDGKETEPMKKFKNYRKDKLEGWKPRGRGGRVYVFIIYNQPSRTETFQNISDIKSGLVARQNIQLPPFLLLFHSRLPSYTTAMATPAEKTSISYSNNVGDERGAAGSALPAHTYVHNTAPQLRVIGNPGPL